MGTEWFYLSEKVLELLLRPDMPDRVGFRRWAPGMLNTAAMLSLAASPCHLRSNAALLATVPPVVLLYCAKL